MKCRICQNNSGRYVVCFKHRDTKYKYNCEIHGLTDFINRQCLECSKLKENIYYIKDNKDRLGNKITKKHYLYPYRKRLTHLNRRYQSQFMKRISSTPGVYGIFYKSTCLYVGQSVNITNRIKQHKDNFRIAKYQLNGLKLHKQRISINKIKHKVEYKYYEMASKYSIKDLTFKTLIAIPKLNDTFEFNELLTYAEQAMIDSYNPKYNHIAARPTKNENNK